MVAGKILRNLHVYTYIRNLSRPRSIRVKIYGRFIWFSSYVRHKFPLNLEFRSRGHQERLSTLPFPCPGPDISNVRQNLDSPISTLPFSLSPLPSPPLPPILRRSILARRRLSSGVYRLLTLWFTIPFHPFEINVASRLLPRFTTSTNLFI